MILDYNFSKSKGALFIILFVILFAFFSFASTTQAQQTADADLTTHADIIPAGLVAGDTFRLIFVTRSGTSDDDTVDKANTHVQHRVSSSSITVLQGFSSQFRALVSAVGTNAIDNTDTNTGDGDTDAPIYWVQGEKVADNYADFYDSNGWDSRAGKDSSGNDYTTHAIKTGSTSDGTIKTNEGIDAHSTATGRLTPPVGLTSAEGLEIDRGSTNNASTSRFYGISPIFTVTGTAPTNNDPTDITLTLTNDPVVENQTAVGTFSTMDADGSDSHTYTLVTTGTGSEDHGSFTIDNTADTIAFTTAPDFETPTDLGDTAGDNTYAIRVQTDDGNGGTFIKTFIITVTDVVETPTITITSIDGEDVANSIYINAIEDDSDITISGTSTDIANGQTVEVFVLDSGGSGRSLDAPVNNNAWSTDLRSVNLRGFDEGEIGVEAGYTGATAANATFTYDATAPTATTIATTDASTIVITLLEDVTDSGTVAIGDFTISGNTISGVTLTSARTITLTVGTQIVSTDEITIEYTGTTLADTAGNTLSIPTTTITNDVPAPVPAITITTPISDNGYVNAFEANAGITVSGTSSDIPAAIRVHFSGIGSGRLVTPESDGTWSIEFPSSSTGVAAGNLAEGTITVDGYDHQNNTKLATETFIYDTTAPTLQSANEIDDQTATVGEAFRLDFPVGTYFEDNAAITYSVSGDSNGISFNPVTNIWEGSNPTEGDVTVVVTATDVAGNTATDEFTITVSPAVVVESDDTTLSVLSLSDSAPLSPTFDSAVDVYYTTVGDSSTITVTATPNDSNATVSFAGTQNDGSALLTISSDGAVSGLTNGVNEVTITVTAEDDSTDTYTLKIYKTGISFVDKIINGYTDGITLTSNADFGRSVANLGDLKIGLTEAADIAAAVRTIAVGAPRDDTGGDAGSTSDRGAIYIINLDVNGEIVGSQIKYDSSHSSFSGLLANESLLGLVIAGLGDLDGTGAGAVTLAARESSGSSGALIRLINIGSDGSIEGTSTIDRTTQGIASFADIGSSIADLGDLDIGNLTEEQETNSVKTLAIGDISTGGLRGSVYLVNIDSSGDVVGPAVAIGSGQITTLQGEDRFGQSVANLGDLDLGLTDQTKIDSSIATIAVGARNSGISRSNLDRSGFIYLININSVGGIVGSPKIITGNPTVSDGDNFPASLTNLGDLDVGLSGSDAENSILTIVAGADSRSVGTTDSGSVVLINIDENGDPITPYIEINNLDDGFTLPDNDRFGVSTTNLGDLDGNGTSILVVGAYGSDVEGENRGAVHILRLGTPTYSYNTGDTVSITLPSVLAGAHDATYRISSSSPALPAGLSFDGTARTITGMVTAATQGSTEYVLTATNSQGETAEYAFNIDVALDNSTLSGLTISPGTLSPAFTETGRSFSVSVNNSSTSVTLTPTLVDSNARIEISGTAADTTTSLSVSGTTVSGLTVGDNVITIVVTSADGAYSTTYTITVTRQPARLITINDVATDNYVNATEDNSDIIISGTSSNIADSETIAVTFSDSNIPDKSYVLGSDGSLATGAWQVTITSAEMQAAAEGTVTITASYTGAADVVRDFTYDRTAPTFSSAETGNNRNETNDITIELSEDITGTATASEFQVSYGEVSDANPTTATIENGNIKLVVDTAIERGDDSITVSYSGTTTLTDTAGNDLATFTNESVENVIRSSGGGGGGGIIISGPITQVSATLNIVDGVVVEQPETPVVNREAARQQLLALLTALLNLYQELLLIKQGQ